MTYRDALDRALELRQHPAALEAFLATMPEWRADLERALAVSQGLSLDLQAITPDEEAVRRAQQQLLASVSGLAARPSQPGSLLMRLMSLLTVPRLALVGVATAVLVLAIALGLPGPNGGGTSTAEAVIEGSVAEVGSGAVTISTIDSSRVVQLSSDTVLTDGFGNTIEASRLSAGQDVVLKGSSSGDDFVASEVELRDRIFGIVTALPGDSVQVSSSKGNFTILITPETEFEGLVAVGAFVEVKLLRRSDGSLVALEIEVEDEDEEDEHEGDDDGGQGSSVPSATSVPRSTPSSGSSSGPGNVEEHEEEDSGQEDDEHEDERDHEDSSEEHEDD